MQSAIRLFAFSLAGLMLSPLDAGDIERRSAKVLPQISADPATLVANLDSSDYATRRRAASGLEKLISSPKGRLAAEKELRRTPWETLSFEVRQQLTALGVNGLSGQFGGSQQTHVAVEEIASLVENLASDQYLERASALERLQVVAGGAALIHETYPAIKRAAAEATPAADVRLALSPVLETARYTWLASADRARIPPPSAKQIASWLAVIASSDNADTTSAEPNATRRKLAERDAAERELLDALAQDQSAPIVQLALETALSTSGLDDDAQMRVRRLIDWSRPGLAAEYWQRRRNMTIQYFHVGVPSQWPGASRPTRFDHVGEDYVRCASGNALPPGEYPLGVAIPHPREQAAFFHLVSLANARQRLIYHYKSSTLDDGRRLQAITERTLGPALADRHPLDDAQLWLLGQLDQPTVGRFLRLYFSEAPDEPFDLSQLAPMLTDVSSVHRTACLMLALDGSYEVVPALVEAAEKRRFLRISTDEPQGMAWTAALAIAEREPWDGVDAWLAGLIARTDRISFGEGTQGDVGATAAAMLLVQHGEQPADFGLVAREPIQRGLHDRFEAPINVDYRRRMFEDRMFKQLGVTPHYFTDDTDRAAVLAWWQRREGLH